MKIGILFTIFLLVCLPIASALTTSYPLEYDANGNLIKDQYNYYEYDDFDQLIRVRQGSLNGPILAEYFYDENGARVQDTDFTSGNAIRTYYSDDFVQVVDETGITHNITYYRDDFGLVAAKDENAMLYYHPDHLGSPTLITDASGNVVAESSFLPFGATLSGNKDRYGFTGQENDVESGLQYFNARYYSPSLSRFTQPDPVIPDVYDPQSLNRYAYARNNPVKYVDPSGNFFWDFLDIGLFAADMKSLASNPTLSNLGWATLSGLSLLPVLPNLAGYFRYGTKALNSFKTIRRGGEATGVSRRAVLGVDRAKEVEQFVKRENDIVQIPIEKLWGHKTDDAVSLFRKGAKTHHNNPITIIQIGDEYMINHGVGTTMRAVKSGEQSVNARIIGSYSSVDDLYAKAKYDKHAAFDKHWWDNLVTKINDPERWRRLEK